jgi:hypothetical protein
VLIAALVLPSVGCMQAMMKKHEEMTRRPAELDLLEPLIGEWETTGEMRVLGSDEVIPLKGTMAARWGCDRRVLIEEAVFEMGEEKMTGTGVWTWDRKARKYRTWWFESNGQVAEGVCRYDAGTKTWKFRGEGMIGPQTGTATLKDPNTTEWTHVEWTPTRLRKIVDMKGTSRRRSCSAP